MFEFVSLTCCHDLVCISRTVHLFVPVCILTHCPFICSCVHSYTLSICSCVHSYTLSICSRVHSYTLSICSRVHSYTLSICSRVHSYPVKVTLLDLFRTQDCEKRTEKEDREPVLVTVTWYLTFPQRTCSGHSDLVFNIPQRTCSGHSDLVFNIPTENLCWSQWLGI